MTRALGYFPDPEDPRDFAAETLTRASRLSGLPRTASVRSNVLTVFDQGQASSCVAQAIAQAIRMTWVERHEASYPPVPNRMAIYWQARAAHDATGQDQGTHPRLAFKAVQAYGFGLESVFPYDPGLVLTPPPPRVYRASYDQAGKLQYARLPDEPDARRYQLMAALAGGLPVVLSLTVDDAFKDYQKGLWRYGGDGIGRHYVTVTSYDDTAVEIVNSWGSGWGVDGFGLVAWGTILDASTCTDPYVITTAPLPEEA